MGNIAAFSGKILDKQSPWLTRSVLCLAVLAAYSNVWPNTFVFDDVNLIVWNDFLKHWSSLPDLLTSRSFTGGGLGGGFYRPLQLLIYFLLYQAFGASTIVFHALNISLHVLNVCLLQHFGIRTGFKKDAAFAAALLWALHPLNTIDVAYMASTAELLWSTFCLLGLIVLLPDFTPRKIVYATGFLMLALCSKETAVIFPALASVVFFFTSPRTKAGAYLKFWPLWLIAIAYTVIRLWLVYLAADTESALPLLTRMLTSLATLPVYLRLVIWPTGLHFVRVFPGYSTLLAPLPLAGILLITLGLLQIFKGKARAASFGILWFFVALAPYTGIVIPINALVSEGWLYMPMAGLFLGVAQTFAGFFEKKKMAAIVLVGALTLILGSMSYIHNDDWRTSDTLYKNIPDEEEYTSPLSLFLGPFYMRQGEFERAVTHIRFELDHAGNYPNIVRANLHWELAMALLHAPEDKDGQFMLTMQNLKTCQHIPEVIAELTIVTEDNPAHYWAHQVLAVIYRYQGNSQLADFHDNKVMEIMQKQGHTTP